MKNRLVLLGIAALLAVGLTAPAFGGSNVVSSSAVAAKSTADKALAKAIKANKKAKAAQASADDAAAAAAAAQATANDALGFALLKEELLAPVPFGVALRTIASAITSPALSPSASP